MDERRLDERRLDELRLDELRLIANPIHLVSEKNKMALKKPTYSGDKLKLILDEKYKNVYLSDLNFKEIFMLIDTYIDDILIKRIVDDCVSKLIDDTIENSDKFDFCLPFD